MRSVRDRMIMSITEIQQLVGGLVTSIRGQALNAAPEQATNNLINQIIEKQNSINAVLQEAEEQQRIQQLINLEEQEFLRLEAEVSKLQQQLRQSQQALEGIVSTAQERTRQSEVAQSRRCDVQDLIAYSHLISNGYSTLMPPNWNEMDSRRPYPSDISELGKLAIQTGILPELDPSTIPTVEHKGDRVGGWKDTLTENNIEENKLVPVKKEESSSDSDSEDLMEDVL